MVRQWLALVFKIIIALSITLVIWSFTIGTDGLNGPSLLKETTYKTIVNVYKTRIVEKTDNYGRGYVTRTEQIWNTVDSVEIVDNRSAQSK
jgi:hypothetical protein